jgi:hypothetical protein
LNPAGLECHTEGFEHRAVEHEFLFRAVTVTCYLCIKHVLRAYYVPGSGGAVGNKTNGSHGHRAYIPIKSVRRTDSKQGIS